MNEPVDLSVYKETLLFLVTAGVVAPLFFRLRISPVLGYLLAGVALGPYGLGAIARNAPWLNALAINVEAIDRIAAFGVVALMFTMGLELSFERLRRMRHLVFGLGLAQVVVTTLILAAAAWRLGLSPPSALAIGAALSMSSTAIVIPMLVESKRLHSGRRAREPGGAAVPGYRGRAPARHDGRVVGGGRAAALRGSFSPRLFRRRSF